MARESPQTTSSRPTVYPLLLLAAVIGLLYAPACVNEFVRWDDRRTLVENRDMNPPTLAGIARYWDFRRPYMDLYAPLTYTVWGAVGQLAYEPSADGPNLNPCILHAASVALHVLSACAAYLLLSRLVRSVMAAWLGALLFAVHPVQVESVAWASGLKDVLAGMLALVALWQYVEYASGTGVGGTGVSPVADTMDADGRTAHAALHYAIATLAFLLAMLAKPSAVITPLLAGIIELLVLRRPLRRIVLPVGFWLILSVPFIIIGRFAQPAASLPFVPPLWFRPVIALDAMAFYLRQLILPLHLGIDYGRSPQWLRHSRQVWFTWAVPVAGFILILVWQIRGTASRVADTRAAHGRDAHATSVAALAALLLFAAALLPTLGLIPFDFQSYSTVTDHYLYLPMLAPALLLAAILARRKSLIPVVVAAVIVAALAVQTLVQIRHWRDSDALFSHALDVNPASLAANVNYGNLLYDSASLAGRARNMPLARRCFISAIACYERAVLTAPTDSDARVYLGNTLLALNRIPEAVEQYQIALKLDPHDGRARAGLAAAQRRRPASSTTAPAGPG